ncbi:MAG: hypothetical protein H0V82_11050 [Candidatus Protochlamydia sp.]|nr:hypothetical protein [Candidatus Protochlamydia sp.]
MTLESIQRYASKYSGKAWTNQVMKVVKATGNQEKFDELHKKLDRNLIGISACTSASAFIHTELKAANISISSEKFYSL